MSYRIAKVNQLIREIIPEIIQREISLKPGVFVSVSKADTSKDLRQCKLYISVYPIKESLYVEQTLKNEIFNIQKKLNQRLQMKIFPRIQFVLDDTQEKVDELESIFKEIENERRENEADNPTEN